eukprot:m.230686 g.230686  ORF g.230686 m.230686 type:complete len:58 (-) comp16002_c0_seq3:442-615(-)
MCQATTFARVLQAEKGNNNKVGLLWEFISLLAAHSAEEARDSLAKVIFVLLHTFYLN